MSDRPEAVLFGRGEDRERVAAMTVEMLAAHGLSPINPAFGLVRAFDVHGDEQLLPDTAAVVAALADQSCVTFCDRDIERANALLSSTTIFGGAPAKADYCIDLGHDVCRAKQLWSCRDSSPLGWSSPSESISLSAT